MRGNMFGKVRARQAAIRHNHPSRGVRLVLITGKYGVSTTALYLAELIREAGESAAAFTPTYSHIDGTDYTKRYDASADSIQRAIRKARKHAQTVVLGVTEAVMRSHVLDTLSCDMVIVASDDDTSRRVAEMPSTYLVTPEGMSTDSLSISPHQHISYGDGELAEACIRNVVLYRRGTEVELTIDHQTNVTLSTHLLGRANAYNIAASVAGGYLLGLPVDTFQEGIARLESVDGNCEELDVDAVYRVYLDSAPSSRSADLVSASMKQLTKRRLLIACDESFDDETLDMLSDRADRVTVVGGQETRGRYHADSPSQAVEHTLRSAKKDDTVLLLGPQFTADTDGDVSLGEKLVREVLAA